DFSPRMAEFSRKTLSDAGEDPGRATVGDIERNDSIPGGAYDAIVATGVFPHNLDDAAAYANIRSRLASNGFALIEYRNALMSLFSINRYSSAFFWSDLLRDGNGLSGD